MTLESSTPGIAFVMDLPFWIATVIFFAAYAMIIAEKMHKTVVAIFAASLMLVLRIVEQHDAFHVEELGVDWNVIILLITMMLIINLMHPTGVFEFIAIRSAKWGKGDPFRIMVIFALVTAVLSALLDNVTTVLLITPAAILIADAYAPVSAKITVSSGVADFHGLHAGPIPPHLELLVGFDQYHLAESTIRTPAGREIVVEIVDNHVGRHQCLPHDIKAGHGTVLAPVKSVTITR